MSFMFNDALPISLNMNDPIRFVNIFTQDELTLIRCDPSKTSLLFFDGSHLIKLNSSCVNMFINPKLEPKIRYGTAFQRHITRIWNLRISYPNKAILLWDDDVSGAFRYNKYHPDIASAFAFILSKTLYIPTGQCFGGNTSAQNFEPLAHAWMLLADDVSGAFR